MEMPLNAFGWTSEEDEALAELVKPHSYLYNVLAPSRKNILARDSTWQEIAQELSRPVEECKKRWRGLRDGYMRSKRLGTWHKTRVKIFEKLHFLDEDAQETTEEIMMDNGEQIVQDAAENYKEEEQQVITDNQEYYEITVVDGPHEPIKQLKPFIHILPKMEAKDEPPKKIVRRTGGRKKAIPLPKNVPPIKILPKPIVVNGTKLVKYVEDAKVPEQRSQTIDKLIERMLKENTNEIDVFFRSMATSVKKLQPNLIPKVKMEVCNVIAKYEMQSFEKNLNF